MGSFAKKYAITFLESGIYLWLKFYDAFIIMLMLFLCKAHRRIKWNYGQNDRNTDFLYLSMCLPLLEFIVFFVRIWATVLWFVPT